MPALLARIALGLFGAGALSVLAAFFWLGSHVLRDADYVAAGLEVTTDQHAVPTISARTWDDAIFAQGYVEASQRMFQMDLMRRQARGRLAELIPAAVELDKKRHEQDWEGVAARGADTLPSGERQTCDRYADGVNRYVADHPGAWGVEYVLLEKEPAPWTCMDTMAIALSMAEQLSSDAHQELDRAAWQAALPDEWRAFVFSADHPWNEPLFGNPLPSVPVPRRALPPRSLSAPAAATDPGAADEVPGSNSWAYRGRNGNFLANDPHLGANVPHLWFLVRLYISPGEWVVGASIPGVPGVIIGMNPHLAWALTNVGEDVDDLVLERLSEDKTRYLESAEGGVETWADLEVREHRITAGARTILARSRHTSRGPLVTGSDGQLYSRRWLPYQTNASLARLWPLQMAQASDIAQANDALDAFTFPAQNVLIMDRTGNLAYRATGTGIARSVSGRTPSPGVTSRWELEAPRQRPRLTWPIDDPRRAVVTANQRIWVDNHGHNWASDRRAERIRRALLEREDHTGASLAALQLDTESRYHREVVRWLATHAAPKTGREQEIVAAFAEWDGQAFRNQPVFSRALKVEAALTDLLIDQLRTAFLPGSEANFPERRMRDGWILRTLADENGLRAFGLAPDEVAAHLLRAAEQDDDRFIADNRWQAQHPFVGRIPVLGELFRVDEYAQWGYSALVRVERPKFGASFRVVWNLSDPKATQWITPIGQSGHIGSDHYKDFQRRYHENRRIPAFDEAHDWGL